jgi:hypothetical protein
MEEVCFVFVYMVHMCGHSAKLNAQAFWMPGIVAGMEETAQKPDTDTICPASGKRLRLKDLITVRCAGLGEQVCNHSHVNKCAATEFVRVGV